MATQTVRRALGIASGTRALVVALAFLCLASAASAQQKKEPTASARLSKTLATLGETIRLDIIVENTRDAKLLEMPKVEGLDFGQPYGPRENSIYRNINGRAFHKVTLEWTIPARATSAGEFVIEPLKMTIEGKTVLVPDEPLTLRVVKDLEGAEHGFFEVIDPPERVYEGEPFTIDLRFGTDITDPANAALYLPWWPMHRGVLELKEPRARGQWLEVPVNDRKRVSILELPPEVRNGVTFRVFQLRRRYVATRPGTLDYESATFEFAELLERGTAFRRGRVRPYFAQCEPFSVEVVQVPEEGRPFEWTGAVGKFDANRRVNRRDVDVGNSLELTVSWFGEGNLEFFEVPDLKRLDEFSGFRVLGTDDQRFDDERRVVYDLVPASPELTEIPAVPLWVFDPELETFRVVETDPVSIRVRPVEDDLPMFETGEDEEILDIRDLHVEPQSSEGLPRLGGRVLWVGGLSLPLLWMLARVAVRRSGDPAAPVERRRRGAKRQLARDLGSASTASGQAAALARFLAARTREPDHAWVGRDPSEWAEDAEHARDVDFAALIELWRELDERAWAGGDDPIDVSRVKAVADGLQRGGL